VAARRPRQQPGKVDYRFMDPTTPSLKAVGAAFLLRLPISAGSRPNITSYIVGGRPSDRYIEIAAEFVRLKWM